MVLCEVFGPMSFPVAWVMMTVGAWFIVLNLSGWTFKYLYYKPTYEIWKTKSNPNYPSVDLVAREILQCLKGAIFAVIPPTLTFWLSHRGYSKGYCGFGQYSTTHVLVSQFCFWLFVDFFSFYYHKSTHQYTSLWEVHKFHHKFYNPTPFAVIADEILDQVARAVPMLIFPLLVPMNLDLMVLQMGLMSYGYGVFLHCGHELDYPDAHHPILNTAYQHYAHHAYSIMNKPYYCGFFLRIFDQLWQTDFTGECVCAKCCRKAGKRTQEQFEKVEKPDYSVLTSPSFWMKQILSSSEKKA